jgi:predicted nuclease of restriction endonuclease-like (RecB) superfamily
MASKPRKPSPKLSEEPRISRGRTRSEAIFPVAPPASALPETYAATLQEIKTHLRNARIRAILAANPVVIEAYWHTGKIILARQQEAAWGTKVIDRLAADLHEAFPDMGGLSSRNLLAMKIFAREFPSGPIAQQPVAQLPWGHVLQIMQRAKAPAARDFYIRETLTHGWSRAILEIQIQNQLHLRVGKAQNNFALTMPPAESDMAAQLFKDPYLFLQLNLYLSAVDDLLRHPDDQPTIGLLLCRKKNRLVAEYALRGLDQSIAVAAWQTQLTESLPEELRGSLPTIKEIEAELAGDLPPESPQQGGSHE